MASIRSVGLEQPIKVMWMEQENVYQLIYGERRFRACRALGWETIPALEERPKDAKPLERKEILVKQIVENWQREDINPFELLAALSELRDQHGFSQVKIAKLTGKPASEISRLFSLEKIPNDVRTRFQEKGSSISRRHLFALASLRDPGRQKAVVDQVIDGRLSALETEKLIAQQKATKATGGKKAGAPIGVRRFQVAHARVVLQFRKRNISDQDVLEALDEARQQIAEKSKSLPANGKQS